MDAPLAPAGADSKLVRETDQPDDKVTATTPTTKTHSLAPLPNEFEIEIPDKPGQPWNAANGMVGVTVFTGASPHETSKKLADGRAWHVWKANAIKKAMTPAAYKEQWLIAELNGVFVHIKHDHETGKVNIVIAGERLN